MKNVLLYVVALALLGAPCAVAQTPGTGNLAGTELVFETGNGTLDGLDKTAAVEAVLTIGLSSGDASLVGTPFITVASLAAAGSDPTNDLGSELGIVGLDFASLIILVNGFAPSTGFIGSFPGGAVISPLGNQFGVTVPCALLNLGGPVLKVPYGTAGTSIYLQSAAPDATKPNGLALTPSIEHEVVPATTAGPTSDDGNVNYAFQCLSSFDFYGVTYTDLFVNSNGNITFGSGDTDFNATEAEMLSDQPRVAPFWTDVSPNIDGLITITETASSVAIEYAAIPNFGAGAGNNLHTMTAYLNSDGSIDMAWAQLDSDGQTSIAGISPGGGLSLANPVDIAGGTATSGGSLEALYQVFDSSCGNEAQRLVGAIASFTPTGVDSYDVNSTAGPAPTFSASGVSPNTGDDTGGDIVQVSGAFFDLAGSYSVEFGAGNAASSVVVIDNCTIECTSPPGTGTVDVIVTDTVSLASATITGAFTYVPAGVNTQNFALGDDSSGTYAMSVAPADFTFYGVSHTSLFVNSNGNVTFGSGDTDFSPSEAEFLSDQPRIAPFWSDLASNTIVVTETANDITIDYNANHHAGGGPNIASLVLDKATGNITMNVTQGDSFNGVSGANVAWAGISAGGGLGASTLADLSAGGTVLAGAVNDAILEGFSGGNYDLDGLSIPFTATGGVGTGPYQLN